MKYRVRNVKTNEIEEWSKGRLFKELEKHGIKYDDTFFAEWITDWFDEVEGKDYSLKDIHGVLLSSDKSTTRKIKIEAEFFIDLPYDIESTVNQIGYALITDNISRAARQAMNELKKGEVSKWTQEQLDILKIISKNIKYNVT